MERGWFRGRRTDVKRRPDKRREDMRAADASQVKQAVSVLWDSAKGGVSLSRIPAHSTCRDIRMADAGLVDWKEYDACPQQY